MATPALGPHRRRPLSIALNNDLGRHAANRGVLNLEMALPPSSVTFLEMVPVASP